MLSFAQFVGMLVGSCFKAGGYSTHLCPVGLCEAQKIGVKSLVKSVQIANHTFCMGLAEKSCNVSTG